MQRYSESVSGNRWFVWGCVAIGVGIFVLAMFASANEDTTGARIGSALVIIPIGIVMLVVGLTFGRLRVEVGERDSRSVLRFHFGPLGPTLNAADIEAVEVMPYRWLMFGGWGIRMGRISGRRAWAYSVPFLRTGVAVTTRGGKAYYISSRQPEALASAVRGLASTLEGKA